MLNFLRTNQILMLENETFLQTANIYKLANNHWYNGKKASWIPFKSFENILESAPHPITNNHRRLFLEDYMTLAKGDIVICMLNREHPLIAPTASKKLSACARELSESWINCPLHGLTFIDVKKMLTDE